MARPMLLIKPDLLEELHQKAQDGVPVASLLRRYNLAIADPTLSRLLSFYSLALSAHEDTALVIRRSLFPEWLLAQPEAIATPPIGQVSYKGKMPFGEWVASTSK